MNFITGILAFIFGLFYSKPKVSIPIVSPTSSPIPTITVTPTIHIPSFFELNQIYGPCVSLPVLIYHHIQPETQAITNKQKSLSVDLTVFAKQLEYLSSKKYTTISPWDLINFFDNQIALPSKPVLLTFDDAYGDFATNAAPLLKQYNFKSTVFVPTGLVDNPGYLSWSSLSDLVSSGLFTFANHTWSHHGMKDSLSIVEKEISTAATQLSDHGLSSKIFAYPYGTIGKNATDYLASHQYLLAFTTQYGKTACRGQRFTLPRIRIGNGSLASYGI